MDICFIWGDKVTTSFGLVIKAETCCHLITSNKVDIHNTVCGLTCESLLLTCDPSEISVLIGITCIVVYNLFFLQNIGNLTKVVGPVVAQSVLRLATGWTVWGSNPGGGEIFRTCPDRPWGPASLLYNGYGVFPGVKGGRDVTLTPHPLLVPWSWKGRAILLPPLWAVRPVHSLSACTRVHFTFTFLLDEGYTTGRNMQ
jgi:hypothetical protein